MLTKNQILDVIKKVLAAYKTSILDKQYATMQYVDDSINSIPKQLVPLSTLIAEDTEGYAYLELNQFEKDKTYIILDDVSTNKFVYATSGIKFKLDGVLLSGAMLFLRTYFPYMTLGIKSSTNTLYFGDADSFWSYNLTNNSKEKNESYSLSMKANKSNVLEKNNTTEYTPTSDYNPATKKYVDDTVSANRIDMCTDEEIDSMLASKLIVNEDDDNVFIHHIIEPN